MDNGKIYGKCDICHKDISFGEEREDGLVWTRVGSYYGGYFKTVSYCKKCSLDRKEITEKMGKEYYTDYKNALRELNNPTIQLS